MEAYELDIPRWTNYAMKVARNHRLPAWYDAEDLAQDALERLVREIGSYDQERGDLEPFITARIKFAILDRVRWLWGYPTRNEDPVPYKQEKDLRTVDTVTPTEAGIAVAPLLMLLNSSQRWAIDLVYWGGVSHRTAARRMHYTQASYNRVYKAAMGRLTDAILTRYKAY